MSEAKLREALECVVERFSPIESDLVFSKRMAIKKCREALAQPTEAVELTDEECDAIWARHAMSDTFDCVALIRDAIAAHEAKRSKS